MTIYHHGSTIFKDGQTSIEDKPRSACPRAAATEVNKEATDAFTKEEKRVTIDEIAKVLERQQSAVREMIESLG